jgi:Holliday junction DNA helicase RuvA
MFYSIKGKLKKKGISFVAIEAGGLGYRIVVPSIALSFLPKEGEEAELYLHLHLREDGAELFGFLNEEELIFFEMLISVSGVGPRTALGILGLAPMAGLKSAIRAGDADTLIKAFGVGRKTAERITIELKDKVGGEAEEIGGGRLDVIDALVGLGYSRRQAQEAVRKISGENKSPEEVIKEVLKQIK